MKFKFSPYDFVTITAFGLNYDGRVQECIWAGDGRVYYLVEFACDGQIIEHRFYTDELEINNE